MISIHGLHFNNLRGDLYGGLTSAVVALPLAMAMGVTSGAGPVAGLYGAIFVGFFAALFGGTPTQVSGPTGPMTVVMAVVFTQYTTLFPENPAQGAAIAFTVVMLGGALQIVFGLLKLGRFISLIPHPVISGFMSGIGVIIILLQLETLLGYEGQSSPMSAIQAVPEALANPEIIAIFLSLFTLLIVYLLPKSVGKFIPPPIFALIAGTLALYLFAGGEITSNIVGAEAHYYMASAAIIGNIPSGLPTLIMPAIDQALLVDMLKSAFILAALGSIDSLLTSLVADNLTRSYHRSNRELIGQGIGNMASGLVGGLPGAGATMRTVVNIRAGGKTPISGALHSLLLLSIVLGLGSMAEYIPLAVLAGILIKVGTDIIDWKYLRQIHHAPGAGILLMVTVFSLTVFVDLISAVAVGMVMASFIFMQRMTDIQIKSMQILRGDENNPELNPLEQEIMLQARGKILVYKLSGPRSFTSARDMVYKLAEYTDFEALVFDLKDVTMIDFSSCQSIAEIVAGYQSDQRIVFFAGASPTVQATLEKRGAIRSVPREHCFEDRYQAIYAASELIEVKDDG